MKSKLKSPAEKELSRFPKINEPSEGQKTELPNDKIEATDEAEKIFEKFIFDRFDPQTELDKLKQEIKNAPAEKQSGLRREKIKEFKRMLVEQKRGMAEIQNRLEEIIKETPNAPEEFYWRSIVDLVKKYRLSIIQQIDFKLAILGYTEKHQKIKHYVEEYKKLFPEPPKEESAVFDSPAWQREFFKDLFGVYPHGKVELEIGPMTILWRCHKLEDYAVIKREGIEEAKKSGGCKIGYRTLPGLEGIINAENLSDFPSPQYSEATRKHEEMHSIEELFPIDLKYISAKLNIELTPRSGWPELAAAVAKLARFQIKIFEPRIKGEILAYLKGRNHSLKEIKGTLLRKKEDGGLYDYLQEKNDAVRSYKDFFEESIKHLVKHKMNLPEERMENVRQLISNVILQKYADYQKDISSAIDAVNELFDFYPGKNPQKELIALLSQEPLDKWRSLADKIWEDYLEKLNFEQLKSLIEKSRRMGRERLIGKIKKFLLKKKNK